MWRGAEIPVFPSFPPTSQELAPKPGDVLAVVFPAPVSS